MSLALARPALRNAAGRVTGRRFVHIDNKVGNVRFDPAVFEVSLITAQNMPFDYSKRAPFAIKLVLFLGTGFAIPFATAAYQLKRHGAAA